MRKKRKKDTYKNLFFPSSSFFDIPFNDPLSTSVCEVVADSEVLHSAHTATPSITQFARTQSSVHPIREVTQTTEDAVVAHGDGYANVYEGPHVQLS